MRKKPKEKKERTKLTEAFSRTLELPVNVMEGLPEIELLGNKEAVVEHCQGILEYDDTVVRINTGKMVLKFTGRNLRLKTMTDESVIVEGSFTTIEFA